MDKGDWMPIFREIKVLDGLTMFGSVAFGGLIVKSISDTDMVDILLGRIRMFYHLDGDRFIELCQGLGLESGYPRSEFDELFLNLLPLALVFLFLLGQFLLLLGGKLLVVGLLRAFFTASDLLIMVSIS